MVSSLASRASQSLLHFFTDIGRIDETPLQAIVRGEGVWVYDEAGRGYIEGMSGLWCTSLGLGNAEIAETAREQIARLSFSHLSLGTTHERAVELAEKLRAMAPMEAAKVFLCSSGSEANDTQIKFATLYNNVRGRPRKKRILARSASYHGATVASASVTGQVTMHTGFDLPVSSPGFVSCPSHYHFAEPGETEEDFASRIVAEDERRIQGADPETFAAFIAEPVMSGAGVVIPPRTYFEKLQAMLDRYEIHLIADEIVTAFGRLGQPFGCQAVGMRPGSMSLGKALSAGYAPAAAVLVPPAWDEAFQEHSRAQQGFRQGFTYGGHPLSCAIALKTLEIYERDRIFERAWSLIPRFAEHMERLRGSPLVGHARHMGLIGALEFAADGPARKPFASELNVGQACVAHARELGLIVRAVGDTIVLCPPLVISREELDELFRRLEAAMERTLDGLVRAGALTANAA